MAGKVYVAVTNIKYGSEELDENGRAKTYFVNAGETIEESEFPQEINPETGENDLLNHLIANGAVAEKLDVIYVEDTEKVEALTTENETLHNANVALEDENARLKAELEALKSGN